MCIRILNLIDSRNCTYFKRKCRAISKKVDVMPKGLMQTHTYINVHPETPTARHSHPQPQTEARTCSDSHFHQYSTCKKNTW